MSQPRYLIWPVEFEAGRPQEYVVRDTVRDDEVVSDPMSRTAAQAQARALNDEPVIPRIAGSKWLREAAYIDNLTKQRVVQAIKDCKRDFPGEKIGLRPASYIGPDNNSRVVVYYGLGQRIYRSI